MRFRLSLPPTVMLACLALAATSCHKKQEKRKPGGKQREEAILKSSAEQAALNRFAVSMREILEWYQTQSVETDADRRQAVKSLAEKFTKVPVEGLPEDIAKAWAEMLGSWRKLAESRAPDAALRARGAKAAQELNRHLAARGIVGLVF